MKDSVIETLELTSTRPRLPRGTAQPLAGKGRVISYISEPETPLWKLTSPALSPVKRGLETALFLISVRVRICLLPGPLHEIFEVSTPTVSDVVLKPTVDVYGLNRP